MQTGSSAALVLKAPQKLSVKWNVLDIKSPVMAGWKTTHVKSTEKRTAWMLQLRGGLLRTDKDWRKTNMAPGEWPQQLTNSFTSTPLVHATSRRAESMTGQNLMTSKSFKFTENTTIIFHMPYKRSTCTYIEFLNYPQWLVSLKYYGFYFLHLVNCFSHFVFVHFWKCLY